MSLPVTGIVEVPADDLEELIRFVHRPWFGRCTCGWRPPDGAQDQVGLMAHVEFLVREAKAGRVLP